MSGMGRHADKDPKWRRSRTRAERLSTEESPWALVQPSLTSNPTARTVEVASE